MSETRRPATEARVVVVNDDSTQLQVLAALCRKAGLDAAPCSSVEQALQMMRQHGRPDLIVTDLHMPEIDGWRFCRLLRSPEYPEFNGTPILVTSATFSGADAAQITADLGANAFLPCPLDGRDYVDTVRALLAGEVPQRSVGVLVIEDQEDLASLLLDGFKAHGYRAWTAQTSAEARRRFEDHQPDITVIDYHLPDLEGDDLLTEFRKTAPFGVFVMMTGDADPGLAMQWMKRGAHAYVRKPFEIGYLIAVCEKARRERSLLGVEAVLEERTLQLRESEERYRTVAHFTHDWEYWTGPDGRVLYVSPSCERITGHSAEEFLQQPDLMERLVHPDDRPAFARHLAEDLETGGPESMDFRILTCRGEVRWLNHVCQSVVAEDGRWLGRRASNRDITERKQLEAHLQQAQKLEAVGHLAGGVAHDFNNILAAITIQLGLLEQEPVLPPEVRTGLGDIGRQVRRAVALTRQLLAFGRRRFIQRKPLNLHTLLSQRLDTLRRSIGARIRLEFQSATEHAGITGDPCLIEQVVTNLLLNARDAQPDGGTVLLCLRAVELDAAQAAARSGARTGHFVCLSVTDTGCGMDEATLQRIFEPFFTTKGVGEGFGLGLATVHGIVKQHEGWIEVESAPMQGTTFRVYLPANPEETPLSPATEPAAVPVNGRGETILVVEDEPAVRRMTVLSLRRCGYRVLEARDGTEALRVWDEHRAIVDLVLSDVVMPTGPSGLELTERLHRDRPDLPVILSSGHGSEITTDSLALERPTLFLQKPFTTAELAAAIRQQLRPRDVVRDRLSPGTP